MCDITFTSLEFNESAGTITLSGTASCENITAQIISPHLTNESQPFPVNQSDGRWQVVFAGSDLLASSAAIKRYCGEGVKFFARCAEDPDCKRENDGSILLDCTGDGGKCPQVTLRLTDVSECVNGLATATFEITVTNAPATPSVFEIVFGDDDDRTIVFNSGDSPLTVTHPYAGGSYTAVVNTILPEGCRPSNQVRVDVSDCGEVCPEVAIRLVSVSRRCTDEGKRAAVFEITVNNAPASDCVYEIIYGDGIDDNIPFNNTTANPITKRHNYSGGEYTVVANSVIPSGCPPSNTIRITIPECPRNCPDDVDLEIIDGGGRRFKVIDNNDGIFEAVDNNPSHKQIDCLPPGRYTLALTSPDESGLGITWREDNNLPVQNNSRNFTFTLEDETKSITVVVVKDDCPPLPETIIIHPCDDGKPVDCEVRWSEWSDCVNNVQTRTGTIITQPRNGGEPCPEDLTQTQDCTDDSFSIPCALFKAMVLIGLGFIFLALLVFICPALTVPWFLPPASLVIAGVLIVIGAILFAIGLGLWIMFCRPGGCDWLALLWQILILFGLMLIYAGFCPVCLVGFLGPGIATLFIGVVVFLIWGRACNPTACKVIVEMLNLFIFAVNAVSIVELIFASCVITTVPPAAIIWAIVIGAFQAFLLFNAESRGCIQSN